MPDFSRPDTSAGQPPDDAKTATMAAMAVPTTAAMAVPPFHHGGPYGALLIDPPWHFRTYSPKGDGRCPKYRTMEFEELAALPIAELAAKDSALFSMGYGPNAPSRARADRGLGLRRTRRSPSIG